ncbi:MAG: hypothetical protein V4475_00535 [Pseudomonadota bacterium]
MSKTLLSSLAIATLAFAAPALAAGPETTTANVASADGAVVTNTVQAASNVDRRYCVVEELTGSRLPHKICKTRKEWLAEGFDPLDQ